MSDSSGVSASYVDSEINRLERRCERIESQINELEREMRDLAQQMVNAIERQTDTLSSEIGTQTKLLAAEAAATVAMLEATRRQIASDFEETRQKLDVQTEAGLQVEIGKKIGEVKATFAKIQAFGNDIELRYEKSIVNAGVNTNLYDVNFDKIFTEYNNKVQTIGSHIFSIWDDVVQPAQAMAAIDPDEFFDVAIAVDLKRLKTRADHLDGTLRLLRSTRLDEILNSLHALDERLSKEFQLAVKSESHSVGLIEALACLSQGGRSMAVGLMASGPDSKGGTRFSDSAPGLERYTSEQAFNLVTKVIDGQTKRKASDGELEELAVAAQKLVAKQMISQDDMLMFLDFLEQEELQVAG